MMMMIMMIMIFFAVVIVAIVVAVGDAVVYRCFHRHSYETPVTVDQTVYDVSDIKTKQWGQIYDIGDWFASIPSMRLVITFPFKLDIVRYSFITFSKPESFLRLLVRGLIDYGCIAIPGRY